MVQGLYERDELRRNSCPQQQDQRQESMSVLYLTWRDPASLKYAPCHTRIPQEATNQDHHVPSDRQSKVSCRHTAFPWAVLPISGLVLVHTEDRVVAGVE